MIIQSESFGEKILGPIFYRFCYQLWIHQLNYNNKDAVALFLSRGGLRIRFFYNQFLMLNKLDSPCPQADCYVSRMSVFKSGLLKEIDWITEQFVSEYQWYSIHTTFSKIFPKDIFETWQAQLADIERNEYEKDLFSKDGLMKIIKADNENGRLLREYFYGQYDMLKLHLKEISGGYKRKILIDTGWSGSIVGAIKSIFPEIDVTAHFFGRYNYGKPDQPWFTHIVGVEVEGNDYYRRNKKTCLLLHRHLIEGVCEMNWPSVMGYCKNNSTLNIEPSHGVMQDSLRKPSDSESLAKGVNKYFDSLCGNIKPYDIYREAEAAFKELARLICYPSPQNAYQMTVATRSADFGKDIDVPVLNRPLPLKNIKGKISQIHFGLWPQGQIALEFPFLRRLIQFIYLRRKTFGWLRSLLLKLT